MTALKVFAVALGFLVVGFVAFADSPTPADADKLVAQLGSAKFAERETALKALEALGPAALPALRRGADAKDPEVRQRVANLIVKHERQADCELAFTPTKVRLKATEQPLADVVADLARQANIRLQLAREPADLAGRHITLDLGEKPFWEALDALCREAKISIRPTTFEPVTTDDANALIVRGMLSMVRADEPLVLQDGVLPPCPTAYLGAVRVRLIPDRWANRNRGPTDEHKWSVEVLSEPRLGWQASPTVQFNAVTGLTVTTNSKDDSMPKGVAAIPGGGMVFAGGPAIRVGGIETINVPRAATRHEIPVYLKADAAGASAISELKGALAGSVKLAPQELASIADVLNADGATAKSKDGTKLMVRDCKVADDGAVTLKVEIERPAAGDGMGNAAVMQRVQIGGGGRGGAMPINVARAIGAMQADGESFRLFDKQGGQYTVSISETSSNQNNGVTVITHTLDCQPPDKDAKPKKLELHGPRRASVDGRFTLRDVPRP